jgi:hypothetical protein
MVTPAAGYVPDVRLLLPHLRDQRDPVELPPLDLITLLFFAVAAGLLLLAPG